jgi:hypothetical protein
MRARDNPFATDRVLSIRYTLAGDTWSTLLARLERLRYRAAIIGPHGAGKTTLLEDLGARLAARGFRVKPLRLDCHDRTFSATFLVRFFRGLAPSDIILLDGAEQLGPRAWRDFYRRAACAAGLIVTTHRRGPLPTLVECRTDAPLLDELVARLLGAVPPDRLASIQRQLPSTDELYVRHRGNIRTALRELYDCCAEPLE